ncbi:MAG TPA: SCO family protein [Kofleriaceae bacterium]
MAHASSSGIQGKKLLLAMLGVLVVAVCGGILLPAMACQGKPPNLPVLGTVSKFNLIDERGQKFSEQALVGHPTIVDFIFTRCDMSCPVMTMTMARLQEKLLDRKADPIKLLSITVDPEHDDPKALAAYAQKYGALPEKWRFITGPKEQVLSLITNSFWINTLQEGTSAGGAPQIAHQEVFMLVDGDLNIRGIYDARDVQKLDDIQHHARFLARTQRAFNFGGS